MNVKGSRLATVYLLIPFLERKTFCTSDPYLLLHNHAQEKANSKKTMLRQKLCCGPVSETVKRSVGALEAIKKVDGTLPAANVSNACRFLFQ